MQEELRAEAAKVLAREERAIDVYNAAKRQQEDQEAARRAAHKDVADRCDTLANPRKTLNQRSLPCRCYRPVHQCVYCWSCIS